MLPYLNAPLFKNIGTIKTGYFKSCLKFGKILSCFVDLEKLQSFNYAILDEGTLLS